MAKKPTVGIVIVNWNGLEHLKICLPTLTKQSYKPITLYIADNDSADGSIEWIKKEYPSVILLENNQNLGFAAGNNVGIERALADMHDYVMLLNNDTEVPSNVVSRLVEYMERHPRVGIAQPKLLLMDFRDTIDSCGSFFTKTGFLIHRGCEEKDAPQYNTVKPMFTIKGAAMIMRRAMLVEVGDLDPDFFAYFEETDLCWRAWLRGWKTHYAPVATVYHKIGGSTKKIGSPVVNYHSFKNHIMSQIKNLAGYHLIWVLPLHLAIICGFSIIYVIALRPKNGLAVYRAIFWNIRHFGRNWRKRRLIQQNRIISDHDLFKVVAHPVDWAYVADFSKRFFVGKKKTEILAAKGQ